MERQLVFVAEVSSASLRIPAEIFRAKDHHAPALVGSFVHLRNAKPEDWEETGVRPFRPSAAESPISLLYPLPRVNLRYSCSLNSR